MPLRILFTPVAVLVACSCLLVAGRNGPDVKRHAIEQCGKNDRNIYELSNDQWCCLCPPGYYKVRDCSFGVPTDTKCKRCVFDPKDSNNQTYMTTENNEMQCSKSPNDSHCESSMNTEYEPGNRTHPSRCKCKDGFYSLSDPYEHGCNEHSPCIPGFQPARFGTSSSDTKCEVCPEGTFSNASSSTSLCMSFSLCGPDKDIEKPGTSKTDFVCSADVVAQDNSTNTPTTTEVGREDLDIGPSEASLTPIILGVVLGLVLVVVLIIVICCIRKSKHREIKERAKKDLTENDGSSNCSRDDAQTESRDENSQDVNSYRTIVSESDENEDRIQKIALQISESPVNEPLLGANKSSNYEFENVETQTTKIQNTPPESTENQDSPHCECPNESLETRIIKRLKEKGGACHENDKVLKENMSRRLRDHDLGHKMLLPLTKHKKSDLQPFVGHFLSETEVDDVEESNPRDVRELKYQWLLACKKKHSRKLTPAYLLSIECDRIFHDDMLDVFLDNFTPRNAS